MPLGNLEYTTYIKPCQTSYQGITNFEKISPELDYEGLEFFPRTKHDILVCMTSFETKAQILGELWINYKGDDEWVDFFEYNDMGLPLAFAFAEGIVNHTNTLEQYINETWFLFLEGLDIEDTGFEDISDLLQ